MKCLAQYMKKKGLTAEHGDEKVEGLPANDDDEMMKGSAKAVSKDPLKHIPRGKKNSPWVK